jgi:hypothetical protein
MDKYWEHRGVKVRWMDNDPKSRCLVVPSRYGGIDYMDSECLSPELYAQIYVTQPDIYKDLKFKMTEEIRNEILMQSI